MSEINVALQSLSAVNPMLSICALQDCALKGCASIEDFLDSEFQNFVYVCHWQAQPQDDASRDVAFKDTQYCKQIPSSGSSSALQIFMHREYRTCWKELVDCFVGSSGV